MSCLSAGLVAMIRSALAMTLTSMSMRWRLSRAASGRTPFFTLASGVKALHVRDLQLWASTAPAQPDK